MHGQPLWGDGSTPYSERMEPERNLNGRVIAAFVMAGIAIVLAVMLFSWAMRPQKVIIPTQGTTQAGQNQPAQQ